MPGQSHPDKDNNGAGRMAFIRSFRTLTLALCAASFLVAPASAQQRFQISDLVQRIERLESEVTRLRVSPGNGGGDVARLDQIEQELRRLTGIIERLDFETRRAASASNKRLDGFEGRLEAVENARAAPAPSPGPVASVQSGFPLPPQALPPQNLPPISNGGTASPFQPQATFQPLPAQPQPIQPGQQAFAPQPVAPSFQNAGALYDEGVRLLNVGQFDQAGAQFEDLIATYPQDPKAGQAQFWLGDMHFKLGRYEQAASAFLESFRNWPEGPKAPDSLLKLGMTLANIGKTEEACLSFRQVPARYPGASPSLLRRADIESQRYQCG